MSDETLAWLSGHNATDDLKGKAVRGGIITILARGGSEFIRLSAMLIMARMLAPSDYGLVAMVTSFFGIAIILRELGLSAATIQRETITEGQASALFWINSGAGLILTLIGVFAAPKALAVIYSESAVHGVAMVLAGNFVLGGLATQHQALINRRMQFGVLAKITVGSVFTSYSIAVILALHGAGYWALIVGAVLTEIMNLTLTLYYCRWRPKRPVFDSGTRQMLAYGGYLTVFNLLGFLVQGIPNIALGLLWGPTVVGYYSRALALMAPLMLYIAAPLGTVSVPALSRLLKEPQRYSRYYLNCISILCLVTCPLSIACMLFSDDIILLLMGPNWETTAEIFKLLAPSLLIGPVCVSVSWIYTSMGRTRHLMWWGTASSLLQITFVAFAAPKGAQAVAIAYSSSLLALFLPCMMFAFKGTHITVSAMLKVCGPAFFSAVLAGVCTYAMGHLWTPESAILRLTSGLAVFTTLYSLLLSEAFSQRQFLLDVISHLRASPATDTKNQA